MRIELENSMLRPTVHDDRYDDGPALGYDEDEDEDEEVFDDDEIDEF